MKNTIVINLDNGGVCECVTNTADDTNAVILELVKESYISPYIMIVPYVGEEVTTTDFLISSSNPQIVRYEIPAEYWNTRMTTTIQLVDTDYRSPGFVFNGVSIDSGDTITVRTGGVNTFNLTKRLKNSTGAPIATNYNLGVVKGGRNVNIMEDGTMSITRPGAAKIWASSVTNITEKSTWTDVVTESDVLGAANVMFTHDASGGMKAVRNGVVIFAANVRVDTITSGDEIGLRIFNVTQNTVISQCASTKNTNAFVPCPANLSEVNAGDVIRLQVINYTGARGKVSAGTNYTYMTAWYVE